MTVYDEHVRMYVDFIDRTLAMEPSLFGMMLTFFEKRLAGRLDDARVIDVACGEGYLSRFLAPLGPRSIVGIDISSALIDIANERTDAPNMSFRVDDAQLLETIEDDSIDVAVSQMAMMDVSDHLALFKAVRRVLVTGGAFVFSLLHPCFEGPYRLPEEDPLLRTGDDEPLARVIWRYASEGYWRSEGAGVRGHVGSYHRMVSTYLNDLVATGFRFVSMDEPVIGEQGLFAGVPRVAIIFVTPV